MDGFCFGCCLVSAKVEVEGDHIWRMIIVTVQILGLKSLFDFWELMSDFGWNLPRPGHYIMYIN